MESKNSFCVVFKKHGKVYQEWFADVESAYDFSAALTQEGTDHGIVVRNEAKQELKIELENLESFSELFLEESKNGVKK